ncbi:MAG: DUF4115 domain-containing protein [Acidobacteria bacterium]|nr:DUF4115 domain-containing protein [Acidobacteriota bacterium]
MSERLKLFGARLKEAIEEKGFSISEISRATKIRKVFIEALLNGEREKLPDDIFVLGYLKAILSLLNLDPDSFIEEYRSLVNKEDQSPKKEKESFSPLPEMKSRKHFFVWLAIIVIILSFSAFFLFRTTVLDFETNIFSLKKNPDLLQINLNTPQNNFVKEKDSFEGIEPQDYSGENAKVPSSQIISEGLVIKSFSKCWVEIFDEETQKVLLKRELSEGEEINFKGNKFRVTLGDSSAAKIFLHGKEVDFPKESKKVLRDYLVSGEPK